MAEQKKHKHEHDVELVEIEPVKQIEVETKDLVVSSKLFIYMIIGLLIYLIFMVIPDIDERMTWMEKDLSAVLVQSERFKISTRVFARDNQCATCHLDPDHLLHNLQTIYPSFSDIKAFMRVGHMRYYTMTTALPDEDLMEVYRTLK